MYGVRMTRFALAPTPKRFRAISGALLLSTQPGEIDNAVESERFVIVKVFSIANAATAPKPAAA